MKYIKKFWSLFRAHGGVLDAFALLFAFLLILPAIFSILRGELPFLSVGFALLGAVIIKMILQRLEKKDIKNPTGETVERNFSPSPSLETEKPKRGFWLWFSLILFLINVPIFIIGIYTPNIGLGGILLLLHGLALFLALPAVIAVLLRPTEVVKVIGNTIALLILLPSTLLNIFLFVYAPIHSAVYQDKIDSILAHAYSQEFRIKGINFENRYLIPDSSYNFVVRPQSINFKEPKVKNIFETLMENNKTVSFVAEENPYVVDFIAKDNLFLNEGEHYKLVESDIKVDGILVDKEWISSID